MTSRFEYLCRARSICYALLLVGFAGLANAAELSLSGSPQTSAVVGRPYDFQPILAGTDGQPTYFRIYNKPAWLNFDQRTGHLAGTPRASDVATYEGIRISVWSNGQRERLARFTVTVKSNGSPVPPTQPEPPTTTGSAIVSWKAPTLNANGTQLTDLAGFHVVYGTAVSTLNRQLDLPAPTFTSAEIVDLSAGTYYFAVKAYSRSGAESSPSLIVSKTIN